MGKPYVTIKLKDDKYFYLKDETIQFKICLRLEKVLKDPLLLVSFKGRASSYTNSIRHHIENIFTVEKSISIADHNISCNLQKTIEIDYEVEVPQGVNFPSYRKLRGANGGKIEYMIEVSLESTRHFKRTIHANHIITVPLVAVININEGELEKKRETNTSWPQREDSNTCVLSAYIPHKGCLLGTHINVQIDFRQPKRYIPVESVLVELVSVEFIASAKDRLPDMTRQLDDKVIEAETKKVDLFPTYGRSLAFNQLIVLPISPNLTPTIDGVSAKVMKLDYKLRVTVELPGKDKKLTVTLPLVIGTTGKVDNTPLTQDMYRGYPTSKPHQTEPLNFPVSSPNLISYYPPVGYSPHPSFHPTVFSGNSYMPEQPLMPNMYPPDPVGGTYLASTSSTTYMYPSNTSSEGNTAYMYPPRQCDPVSADSNQSYPPPFYTLSTRNSVAYIHSPPFQSPSTSVSGLSEAIDNMYVFPKKDSLSPLESSIPEITSDRGIASL